MRAQPSRRSSTRTGSPSRSSVTRSASSRGSARTGATSTEQRLSTARVYGSLWIEHMFATLLTVQLRIDAADRLVELVEERRGPIYAEEAARRLFALRHIPAGLARSLLDDIVGGDARLAWSGDSVRLATPLGHDLPLESATYVVVDLETTGLRPGASRPRRTRRPREPLLARVLLRHGRPALPPRASGRAGDGRGAPGPHRPGPGAWSDDCRGPVRARLDAHSPCLREALASLRRPALAGRLPLPRPVRPGAVRRPRAGPAGPPPLVLPLRPPATGGGGGPRS